MRRLPRPIFVVGCPRSGTTLVQCILSASSHAFSLPETHFFSWILPDLHLDVDATLSEDQVWQFKRGLDRAALVVPEESWSQLVRQDLTPVDLFVDIVEHFSPAPDLRAIEKTPLHVFHMDLIGEVFPDAVFVNVVRDPIDVASSLQGVPFEKSRSMLSHAQRWLESIEAARRYATSHPGRIYTVVYEALVREPEQEVRTLCHAVGLDYEPRMLEEFGREAARNIGRDETWKRDIRQGMIVDRKGVWRTRVTPGQAWLVAQTTRRPRRQYGYTDMPSARIGSIAAALMREASVRFREALPLTGFVGAARHAGSVLKTLAAA